MAEARQKGMIDVSRKRVTKRTARARAEIRVGKEIIKMIEEHRIAKGDVFEHARIAGVLAAKKTGELIPLCHPLMLDHVGISFEISGGNVVINTSVTSRGRTGVEMEALTAASFAALTIYDLCKMYSKSIEIRDVYLLYKSGGKSGTFRRKAVAE